MYKNEGAYALYEGAHALMLEIMHDLKHEDMNISWRENEEDSAPILACLSLLLDALPLLAMRLHPDTIASSVTPLLSRRAPLVGDASPSRRARLIGDYRSISACLRLRFDALPSSATRLRPDMLAPLVTPPSSQRIDDVASVSGCGVADAWQFRHVRLVSIAATIATRL